MKLVVRPCLPESLAAILCLGAPLLLGFSQPPATGVWHHFGESRIASGASSAPAAKATAAATGVWYHFGDAGRITPAPTPASRPREVARTRSIGELELELLNLVNRDRADPANAAETGGRALPLKWNSRLAAVARAHSEDMMLHGYFAHIDPEGRSPGTRVKAAGVPWQAEGENIAIDHSVAGAEAAFMNEPRFAYNHRGNILSPKYTEVGIGIVQARNGTYYVTQEFLEPPADLRASFPK